MGVDNRNVLLEEAEASIGLAGATARVKGWRFPAWVLVTCMFIVVAGGCFVMWVQHT